MVMFKVKNSLIVGRVRAVPRLCVLYPDICLTTEGKSMDKTSVTVVEKCQVGMIRVDTATFWG